MKIIYFDLCAIPFYILTLWICYSRKLTKGHANRLFILTNWLSIFCVFLDIIMEFVVNPVPLSRERVIFGILISFTYKYLRNSSMVFYLLFIIAFTRTEHLLRPLRNRILLWLPFTILAVSLIVNFFTGSVFSVTAEAGYTRGPLIYLLYVITAFYGLFGAAYCIYCKRYLPFGKWIAILSVYVLTFIGVGIQMYYPQYLVEMFCTSIGIMMILLLVMRPEESIDGILGIPNWKTYRNDLINIIKINKPAQILAISIINAKEISSFWGENKYNMLLKEISQEIQKIYPDNKSHVNTVLYIERPGTFYFTLNDAEYDLADQLPFFLEKARSHFNVFTEYSIHIDIKACLIRFPDDLSNAEDIINLGQKFPQFGKREQTIFLASDIVESQDYKIMSHMEEILGRAISNGGFEMYYQPIYSNHTRGFNSAEALLRLKDPTYGMISPGIFIPFAESNGLILPIGEIVLEEVFRFISEHDLNALGLSYIEINLSVAQVLQSNLPQTIRRLQEKYHVDPGRVNFEITETLFDNISEIMDKNVNELKSMGYGFALDDYGIGYSNIQRMSKLPLDLIKIDKSLVDEMFTTDGKVIIHNTIRMMQGIHKELVVEGVETREENDALAEMSCDYIQGFFYSKPLPENEFVEFLKEHNYAA